MMGCDYKDCRVPPERHTRCAAKDISKCWRPWPLSRLQHQHTPKRSQGGKECWVMLCEGHHDCIDNGTRYEGLRLRDRVIPVTKYDKAMRHEHGRVYIVEDRETGEILLEVDINGDDSGDGDSAVGVGGADRRGPSGVRHYQGEGRLGSPRTAVSDGRDRHGPVPHVEALDTGSGENLDGEDLGGSATPLPVPGEEAACS